MSLDIWHLNIQINSQNKFRLLNEFGAGFRYLKHQKFYFSFFCMHGKSEVVSFFGVSNSNFPLQKREKRRIQRKCRKIKFGRKKKELNEIAQFEHAVAQKSPSIRKKKKLFQANRTSQIYRNIIKKENSVRG